MKSCKYCKEQIADDAKKCKHCGSSLTVLGWLINKAIPIISVLIALMSWGQTINVQNQKEQLAEDKKQVIVEKQLVEAKKDSLEINLKAEKEEKEFFKESLKNLEIDFSKLKNLSVNTTAYRKQMLKLDRNIEKYNTPVKNIGGKKYIEVK